MGNTNTKMTFESIKGPIAKSQPHKVLFGNVEGENRGTNPDLLINPPIERNDDLFWLRNKDDPKVLAHLDAERAFIEDKGRHFKSLQEFIYKRQISHLKEDTRSALYLNGFEYYYYERTVKGLPYLLYCRIPVSKIENVDLLPIYDDGNELVYEELILDVNDLAKECAHCDVKNVRPDPNTHKKFAYAMDRLGDEVYEIRFIGVDWAPVVGVSGGNDTSFDGDFSWSEDAAPSIFEWSNDGKYLFYATLDEEQRADKVWIHKNGTSQDEDLCIYTEKDAIFGVGISKSRCGKYLVIDASSSSTTEQYILELYKMNDTAFMDNIWERLILVQKRQEHVRYNSKIDSNGVVFIVTNYGDQPNKVILMTCIEDLDGSAQDLDGSAQDLKSHKSWESFNEIIAHSESRTIDTIHHFEKFRVVTGREHGLTQMWFMTLLHDEKTSKWQLEPIPIDGSVYTVEFSGQNKNFDAPFFRYTHSSPISPKKWIDVMYDTMKQKVVRQTVINNYNQNDFVCERMSFPSFDGTLIDITLIRQKDLCTAKPNAVMLFGYGAYGESQEPEFELSRLAYVEREVIYCIAHIRGGTEKGRQWHELHGKLLNKRNTFMDFIAAAEFLIDKGITTPSLLAAEGRSAGGLLIATVINMRPDLFKVVIAGVPFVDVMTTMCDSSIPGVASDWEEYGNPNERKYYDYMLSYSPVDNVRRQHYPNVLLVGGLHDNRVQFWEPTKLAARLRKSTTSNNDILLKIDSDAGHFSASDRYKFLYEEAFEQAYVMYCLGLSKHF